MLEIIETTGFRRDIKHTKKRGKDLSKLAAVVELIARQEPLPLRCRPHKLSGNWAGYWDCHIEPDWILIYEITDTELVLVRTGAHADFF